MSILDQNQINIDLDKFEKVLNIYYSFLEINELDSSLFSFLKTKKIIEIPETKNILDLFLWITSEINSLYSINDLKKIGQYHTNSIDIVNLILDNVVDFNSKSVINKRFLEPSCGTGIFILTIIYRLYKKGFSKENILNFVSEKIVGFDISSDMVFFTKLNIYCLMCFLYKDSSILNEIELNIYVTDATFKPENSIEQLELFNSELEFIETEQARKIKMDCLYTDKKFDYIIGNPPYVTLYGRRDMKKSEKLRTYYIKNYNFVPPCVKNGKFNMNMFFFEQSLDWLNEDGYISFIVDISFFETAFKHLRRYILEHSKIKYLITDLATFNGVGSGQIIISLQKSSDLEENLKHQVKVIKYEIEEEQVISQKNWYEEDENKFSIIHNRAIEILAKIEGKSITLESIFPGKSLRTCTMMLDMEDKFIYYEKIDTINEIMPYYVGSKSLKTAFGALSFEKYFEYNKPLQDRINDKLKKELEKQGIKNKKRIGLGNLEVYKSPKIFIRQSAKEIISTLSFETAAANNSLYCLSEAKSDEESVNKLKITSAQLNSTILTFYALCKRIIRISRGKQPQIKVSDLKQIRLTLDEDVLSQLLEITNSIISNSLETRKGIEQINNVLFDYYGINNNEKEFILEHIKTY
ncbi:N-6 DNA methylase [Saccharibacillus sp. JS10]|uniref:Eco57I restriction-modification methylase domain-containing protein n=1 Tax=Saccharibacillus sp. JS10 TaxID=2950552 RepID=UPI00210D4E19|nr:N-6 DNA methylase [Saccharibacillus sp. JS10]MCQ4088493.1 BREX-1 system adenine-specific DNA-methyltransferase PglX [Saccharibacillus sp. JS10]